VCSGPAAAEASLGGTAALWLLYVPGSSTESRAVIHICVGAKTSLPAASHGEKEHHEKEPGDQPYCLCCDDA